MQAHLKLDDNTVQNQKVDEISRLPFHNLRNYTDTFYQLLEEYVTAGGNELIHILQLFRRRIPKEFNQKLFNLSEQDI